MNDARAAVESRITRATLLRGHFGLAHDIIGTYNLMVAQITIYVPEGVARRIKREAKRRKKSVSAFIADLATGRGTLAAWPKEFFRLQGSCRGSLRAPEDPPPDELSL